MTRVGKGVGFGAQRTGRFGETLKSVASDEKSRTGGSFGTRTQRSRVIGSQASVNSETVSSTRSVELFGLDHKAARPPSSPIGDHDSVGASRGEAKAASPTHSKVRSPSPESMERRRVMKKDLRAATTGSGHIGYPFGPMISVSNTTSSSIGSRPSTSSFCPGKRSTPSSWLGGSLGKDSPGPCYVANESAMKLRNRRLGNAVDEDKIIMMERPTTGLVLGREKRFCEGTNSFISMTSPSVSPGSHAYRPESAVDMVHTRRATGHTFKPRRAFGDVNAHLLKAQVPGSKYNNVSGKSLDTLSVYTTHSGTSFGRAHREHPHSEDFVYMSAPPTCKQRIPYNPKHPASSGMHSHRGLGTTQNMWPEKAQRV